MQESLVTLSQFISERLDKSLPDLSFYMMATPVFMLIIGSLFNLMIGVFKGDPEEPNATSFGIALVTLVGAIMSLISIYALHHASLPISYLNNAYRVDDISIFGTLFVLAGTLITFVLGFSSNHGRNLLKPELCSLLLMVAAGLVIMISAGEFSSLFVGLEIASICLYVLVGYQRLNLYSIEAAVKYFILGSAASASVLIGAALLYATTGSLNFSEWYSVSLLESSHFLPKLGALFLICGLSFKIALAPFHSWVPDVYQASHSNLSGLMASLVKLSIVIVFLRVIPPLSHVAGPVLTFVFWFMGALSITIGSVFGLAHQSIKRVLSYSSIANAGYFCLGLSALSSNPESVIAQQCLTGYASIYAILTITAFAILSRWEEGNSQDLLRYQLAGLGRKDPFFATCFTIILLGLAGIPPFAGFIGKFLLINAAVTEGFIGFSILLVLLSCVSLYYYLALLVEMWLKEENSSTLKVSFWSEVKYIKWVVGSLTAFSVFVGVYGPKWTFAINFETTHTVPAPLEQLNELSLPEEGS